MGLRVGVFLDRDGVINEEAGYVLRPGEARLIPGAAGAIRRLNDSGAVVIVVTNQSAVARGLATVEEVKAVGLHLEEQIRLESGGRFDAYYYCPHYPERTPGGDRRFQVRCDCRKPGPASILKGIERFGLDAGRSYMVGDQTSDILAGGRAGVRTVLVKTGKAGGDGAYDARPDLVAEDLSGAVERILKETGGGRAGQITSTSMTERPLK